MKKLLLGVWLLGIPFVLMPMIPERSKTPPVRVVNNFDCRRSTRSKSTINCVRGTINKTDFVRAPILPLRSSKSKMPRRIDRFVYLPPQKALLSRVMNNALFELPSAQALSKTMQEALAGLYVQIETLAKNALNMQKSSVDDITMAVKENDFSPLALAPTKLVLDYIRRMDETCCSTDFCKEKQPMKLVEIACKIQKERTSELIEVIRQ